jgi:flavoprotein
VSKRKIKFSKVVKKLSKVVKKIKNQEVVKFFSKSCQKVVKKFKILQTVVGGNSSSKAFGIRFADRPKAKTRTE